MREPAFQAAAICRRVGEGKPCYTNGMLRSLRGLAALVGFSHWIAISSCTEPSQRERVQIRTAAMIGTQVAECARSYSRWGKTFGLADARLYVSRVELLHQESMTWELLELEDNPWQSAGVALLDFENAQGACADFGTASVNAQLVGTLPEGRYIGLRFTLGLPQEDNHIDPATTRGPLAEPGMFWTWQAGYKFVKVDVKVDGSPGAAPVRNNIHLGSTGCTSLAPMIPPTGTCTRPNLARVTLFPFDFRTERVEIALDSLLAPVLTQDDARAPNCMGGPSEPAHCETVMRIFGLEPQSGRCLQECSGQALFRAGGQS